MTDLILAPKRSLTSASTPVPKPATDWSGVVYKLLGALTAPVAGTLISAISGPAWLTWLSLSVALAVIAACFVALAMERRTALRSTRQPTHYAR
ncbi:hypothetical protein ABGB07_44905 [Micromonosporaceae bacterium B7E4]